MTRRGRPGRNSLLKFVDGMHAEQGRGEGGWRESKSRVGQSGREQRVSIQSAVPVITQANAGASAGQAKPRGRECGGGGRGLALARTQIHSARGIVAAEDSGQLSGNKSMCVAL